MKTNQAAFSLLELSIVLVIIGLLSSGVLIGRDLMKAAELQRMAKEVNTIKAAVLLFNGKYGNLPGDLPNATTFWPGVTNNGNGDGKYFCASNCDNPTVNTEGAYIWHHLSLAGMYGSFERPDTIAKMRTVGLTFPEIYEGSGLMSQYRCDDEGTNPDRYDICRNFLQLAAFYTTNHMVKGVIDPVTANQLDRKLDDGLASSGEVVTYPQSVDTQTLCTTSNWDAPTGGSDYILSNEQKTCRMAFFF